MQDDNNDKADRHHRCSNPVEFSLYPACGKEMPAFPCLPEQSNELPMKTTNISEVATTEAYLLRSAIVVSKSGSLMSSESHSHI